MKYRVKRQDDHGNIFNASVWYADLAEAEAIKHELERVPHKQHYWIEDGEGRRVDVHPRTQRNKKTSATK